MKSFVKLEEAIQILSEFENKEIIEVNLLDAVGSYLAESIFSPINNPPFNKSAMDGYAVNFDEKLEFEVIGEVFAGDIFNGEVKKNQAIKIMTGAKVPNECTFVIKKEEVIISDDKINLTRTPNKDENICFIGEDITKGQLLVQKGKKLDYSDIGIISSSGVDKVQVYKKPKIAFLTTGDEVIDIGENLLDAKIYNSNKYSILSRLKELGYECSLVKHLADDIENISNEIEKISTNFNLIITTGGASVGDKDFVIKSVLSANGEILFNKVKIKPGSAVIGSKINDTLMISLSGNPTASLTTFELLVKPILSKLSGNDTNELMIEDAFLDSELKKKNNVRRFARGRYYFEDGLQKVEITQVKSGNGILSSTLNSNCIIEIDKGVHELEKDQKVKIIKL
ncbi:MAG: molybdopterin molybdotransferase MoeA [Peptostreptococcaceae bacterium]